MPGPVSDSYDPEFGTWENAEIVRLAVQSIVDKLHVLSAPRNIVEVVRGSAGAKVHLMFTERELRIIRFACNRALESL